MHWILFPYIKPGESFAAPTVVVRFHDGDWHGASQFYREWFDSCFKTVDTGRWIHQIDSFMNTMFLLSEGVVKYRFSDMPQWAASAAKCGMKAVPVSGWDLGSGAGTRIAGASPALLLFVIGAALVFMKAGKQGRRQEFSQKEIPPVKSEIKSRINEKLSVE